MQIPTLTAGRLTLRGFRASDWDDLAAMNSDPPVRQWLGGTILNRSQTWTQMEAILGQWALRGYGLFAVEVDGGFAGRVGLLHPADWPEPELAWTVATPFWGRGLVHLVGTGDSVGPAALARVAFATVSSKANFRRGWP
jgi:RimJ/RimL family protein N-acetyltransferase